MSTGNSEAASTPTGETAKQEARGVRDEGMAAGQHVADVAKDEAGNVAGTVASKGTDLLNELGSDLRKHAGEQQQNLAQGLRSMSDELKSMAENSSGDSGTATHWVRQAAHRAGSVADWLGDRDPDSVLDEVKDFARRRPAMFLGLAVGAGLLAGRVTRGLTGGAHDRSQSQGSPNTPSIPAPPRHTPPTPDYQLVGGTAGVVPGTQPLGTPRDPVLDPETGWSAYGTDPDVAIDPQPPYPNLPPAPSRSEGRSDGLPGTL